ncbi:MAG TPA: DUF4383 domain-containing protein [Gemmatimonadales bacterium]|nr:DUF4383 domain-containing protein [Gemmatimonadales bacterium]
MSLAQRMAQIFGILFLIVAVLGFLVSGGSMDANPATAPRVIGLFPVNLLHNLVHLAFGLWGIFAARMHDSAVLYCRVSGVVYLLLFVLGFIIPSTFGLIPIGGPDVWLHLVLGAVLAFVGFAAKPYVPEAGLRA